MRLKALPTVRRRPFRQSEGRKSGCFSPVFRRRASASEQLASNCFVDIFDRGLLAVDGRAAKCQHAAQKTGLPIASDTGFSTPPALGGSEGPIARHGVRFQAHRNTSSAQRV